MGSYTVVTFSESQQEHFGVDEQGEVKDQTKFKAAISAAKEAKREAASEEKHGLQGDGDELVNV